jgi:hypothetical protein
MLIDRLASGFARLLLRAIFLKSGPTPMHKILAFGTIPRH